jgi:hypothetical protein
VIVKTLKNIGAVLCVAALAVPAAVSAKGPSGDHGKSGQQQATHVNKRCNHKPNVGFTVGGTLDPSSTADNIVIVVTHSNKNSKPFVTNGKYTVPSGSTVVYDGSNPFTTQGADLTKYRVQVVGKVIKYKKGCTAANAPAPTIKKVTIHAPDTTSQEQQPAAQSA